MGNWRKGSVFGLHPIGNSSILLFPTSSGKSRNKLAVIGLFIDKHSLSVIKTIKLSGKFR